MLDELFGNAEASPFEPFELDDNFNALRALMKSKRAPVALVGSGARVASGYPNWTGLLKALNDELSRSRPSD
jgi:hypothetical protein